MTTDDRSPRDIQRAHELGRKYGRLLSSFPLTFKYWLPTLHQLRGTAQLPFARALLRDLVLEVGRAEGYYGRRWPREAYYGRGLPLDARTRIRLTDHLERALRLLAFGREAKLGGVLVVVSNGEHAPQNGLKISPLFDIYNPRARLMLERADEETSPPDLDENAYLRRLALRAAESESDVKLVPRQKASIGFMTLFADSVRSIVHWFKNSNTSYVNYTLHSNRPGGLQVQYYPQYFTSPVVFGSTLSTPVSQLVLIGHYHFLGQPPGGPPILDPAVFFASPSTSVGNTVKF